MNVFSQKNITIPTFLTLARLVLSLTILPFLMDYILPLDSCVASKMLVIFCGFLSATDFFDGFLARRYKQETSFGAWLDPLADKCFVGVSLWMLMIFGRISCVWVILLMGRELLVTCLRCIAQTRGFSVPVIKSGKLKAVFQFSYIVWAVGMPWGLGFTHEQAVATFLLVITVLLSLGSGVIYGLHFVRQWYLCARK